MRTSLLMNSGFVDRHRRRVRAGPGLVYLQRRPHEHVQPQRQHPQDAGQVPGRLGRPRTSSTARPAATLLDMVGDADFAGTAADRRRRARSCRRRRASIGPYELHDFFLFHFLRYGAPPEKILFLAGHARFERHLHAGRTAALAAVFVRRFFANQFKRSCLPDGPKVGSISLSPRGDWRMPSDAQAALWLRWLEAQPVRSKGVADDGERVVELCQSAEDAGVLAGRWPGHPPVVQRRPGSVPPQHGLLGPPTEIPSLLHPERSRPTLEDRFSACWAPSGQAKESEEMNCGPVRSPLAYHF